MFLYLGAKKRVPFLHISQSIISTIVSANAIDAATIKVGITSTCKVTELQFLKCWNLFPSIYARHNLECLWRVSFWGAGSLLQLQGSQYVWVHFFPLHGKWMWGPEGDWCIRSLAQLQLSLPHTLLWWSSHENEHGAPPEPSGKPAFLFTSSSALPYGFVCQRHQALLQCC